MAQRNPLAFLTQATDQRMSVPPNSSLVAALGGGPDAQPAPLSPISEAQKAELDFVGPEATPQDLLGVAPQPEKSPLIEDRPAVSPEQQEIKAAVDPATGLSEDIKKQILSARSGALDDQRAGIKGLEEFIDKARDRKTDVDLTPLAQISDFFTGGDLAKTIKGQAFTEDKKDALLFSLDKELQKQKQVLTDDEIDLLGAKLKGTTSSREAGVASRFGERSLFTAQNRVNQSLNKRENDVEKTATTFSTLDGLLRENTTLSLGTAASQFARVIAGEKGVLTDKDVTRVIPKNIASSLASFKDKFANFKPGEPLPEGFTEPFLKLVRIAKLRKAQKELNSLNSEATRTLKESVFKRFGDGTTSGLYDDTRESILRQMGVTRAELDELEAEDKALARREAAERKNNKTRPQPSSAPKPQAKNVDFDALAAKHGL